MPKATVVVPCFNEAQRLDVKAFTRFAAEHPIRLILVDDGSTDGTFELLESLRKEAPEHFDVLRLEENRGKAEAVRRGLLRGFETGAPYVGYWDADLATPLEAIPAFWEVLDQRPGVEFVFGARVKLLGRVIERKPGRHYLGRIFATVVSQMLDLPIYDTQCGAKLMRASPAMRELFEEPFVSGWIFDVEIIARLIVARQASGLPGARNVIYELPLTEWRDVGGSKIGPGSYLKASLDVLRIYRTYLRRLPRSNRERR